MGNQRSRLRFDDSLAVFARTVVEVLGEDAFDYGRALRDAFGRLGYLSRRILDAAAAERLQAELKKALGPYFASDSGLIQPSEFGFDRLWSAPTRWEEVRL